MANISFPRFVPFEEGFPPLLVPAGLSFPRGKITEVFGKGTSGGTTLILSAVSKAAAEGEACVYVDACDALDAGAAGGMGIGLHRLLWVRCGGDTPRAMKATDLVLQAGSFGVVVLDLGDVPVEMTRRIPLNYWYRFRRAVEGTRTIFLVLGQEPNVRQCASCCVEAARSSVVWPREQPCLRPLVGVSFRLAPRKPAGVRSVPLEASVRDPWRPMIAE